MLENEPNPHPFDSPTQSSAESGLLQSVPDLPPAALPDPYAKFPEDLRVPWRWLDVVLFVVFGLFSLVVIETIAAVTVMEMYGLELEQVIEFGLKNARFVVLRQGIWFGVVMLFLYANVRVRFRAPFWKTFRWVRTWASGLPGAVAIMSWLFAGAVLALTVSVASQFVVKDKKLPIEELFRERIGVMLIIALGILVAPLVEEIIFRGFLYPVLARSLGMVGGVVATGLAFGALHASQLGGSWGPIALICLVGTIFTYVRARTGSVIPGYLLHLGYNTLLFTGFVIQTSGLRNLPPSP